MDEGRAFPLPAPQSGAWDKQAKAARPGRAAGGRATFVTIATADRAAQARVFARSARDCHPDARLIVLIPNGDGPPRIFDELYDLVIAAEELSLGCLADMRFRYSTAELCFALKPWIIRHLFERFPDDPIFYFDSDIEVFSPLAEVEAALAHGANLVLTPHILQPAPDQRSERALLRSGSFNAGFVAVAPSAPPAPLSPGGASGSKPVAPTITPKAPMATRNGSSSRHRFATASRCCAIRGIISPIGTRTSGR